MFQVDVQLLVSYTTRVCLLIAACWLVAGPHVAESSAMFHRANKRQSPYGCQMHLRLFNRTANHEGNNRCVEQGLLLVCAGACGSGAEVVTEGDKVVYKPDSQTCQGDVGEKSQPLVVPKWVYCDGQLVANKSSFLFVPRCGCKQCPF
jgi:hypothetical protein